MLLRTLKLKHRGELALVVLLAFLPCFLVGCVINGSSSHPPQTAGAAQLSVNPLNINFGETAVGSLGSAQVLILSNSGSSSLFISKIDVSGTGFTANGLSVPFTLTAGQTTALTILFAPRATGGVTGTVSIASNAANSPATITLAGSGVSTGTHSVDLTWVDSTSDVSGYDVYRSSVSGGPYTKLNSSPIPTPSFIDTTVQAGQKYFYVTSAVDFSGVESPYSNEVSATIPTP